NSGARFRSGDDARLRPGVSLGKDRPRILRHDWRSAGLCGTARRFVAGNKRMRGLDLQLFRARSSTSENLRFVSKRCVDAGGAHLLSLRANDSAAARGMSRHLHLLVDEAGRAYSANLARLAAELWG